MDNETNELLAAANPFPDLSAAKRPKQDRAKLLEEIKMSNQKPAVRKNPKPAWQRPTFALPTAFAALLLIVGTIFTVNLVAAPSALAQVTEAASNTSTFDSGRVSVVVDSVQSPDGEVGRLSMETVFQGDRSQTSYTDTMSDTEEDDIFVAGDYTYFSDPPGTWFKVESTEISDFLGNRPTQKQLDPKHLLSLIEKVEKVDDQTFKGSLDIDALETLEPNEFPAGLSLVTRRLEEYPTYGSLEFVVRDERLVQLKIFIDGDTEAGPFKANIATTYSELGQPQEIELPADELVSELETFGSGAGTVTREDRLEPGATLYEESYEGLNEDQTKAVKLIEKLSIGCSQGGGSFNEQAFQECMAAAGGTEYERANQIVNEMELEFRRETFKDAPANVQAAAELLAVTNQTEPELCNNEIAGEPFTESVIEEGLYQELYEQCLVKAGRQDMIDAQKIVTDWSEKEFGSEPEE